MKRRYFCIASLVAIGLSMFIGSMSLKYPISKPISSTVQNEISLLSNHALYLEALEHCRIEKDQVSNRCKAVYFIHQNNEQKMSLRVNKRISSYVMN